jgi:hypothetical protein
VLHAGGGRAQLRDAEVVRIGKNPEKIGRVTKVARPVTGSWRVVPVARQLFSRICSTCVDLPSMSGPCRETI